MDVLVLGAGVIGLTTAVTLADAGHRVLVRTAEPPELTTSATAGALWGPWLVESRERVLRWAADTLRVLTEMAELADSGVRLVSGTDVSKVQHEPPDWLSLLGDARPCTPAELPAGYPYGTWYTAPLVDMPVHLDHLGDRLRSAGGTIEVDPVATLGEATALVPTVVNCTGVGAGVLVDDQLLRPVRGQNVLVADPGITRFLEVDTGESTDLIGVYPHGGHVVLGGTAEPGSWSREPDLATAEAILARCAALLPELRAAEILGHRVGLRPTRPEVRLEDQPGPGHSRIVHNYGHGGAGVSLAWGCAAAVLTMIS